MGKGIEGIGLDEKDDGPDDGMSHADALCDETGLTFFDARRVVWVFQTSAKFNA